MSLFKKSTLPAIAPAIPPIPAAPVAAADKEAVTEAARIEADKVRKKKGSGSTFINGSGFSGATLG